MYNSELRTMGNIKKMKEGVHSLKKYLRGLGRDVEKRESGERVIEI